MLTIPSERVCVDLVGPFSKAKGGVECILTYIDVATRLPEEVPLRTTTAQVMIKHVIEIFSRNEFLGVLVSDDGPQFISKTSGAVRIYIFIPPYVTFNARDWSKSVN